LRLPLSSVLEPERLQIATAHGQRPGFIGKNRNRSLKGCNRAVPCVNGLVATFQAAIIYFHIFPGRYPWAVAMWSPSGSRTNIKKKPIDIK